MIDESRPRTMLPRSIYMIQMEGQPEICGDPGVLHAPWCQVPFSGGAGKKWIVVRESRYRPDSSLGMDSAACVSVEATSAYVPNTRDNPELDSLFHMVATLLIKLGAGSPGSSEHDISAQSVDYP